MDAERLIEWLPPQGMSGRVELWEPKPDGRFRLALRYDDPASNAGKTTAAEDLVEGRFVELLANERMIWAVTFRSDDPAFAGEMRMTWQLVEKPLGTEITITAENVPTGISAEDHVEGLFSTLDNLARYLG